MSNWTQATGISAATRQKVFDRDAHRCVLCGRMQGLQAAHIVPRSRGGMGREENLATLCWICHSAMDSTSARGEMRDEVIDYVKCFYPEWNENEMIYRRHK